MDKVFQLMFGLLVMVSLVACDTPEPIQTSANNSPQQQPADQTSTKAITEEPVVLSADTVVTEAVPSAIEEEKLPAASKALKPVKKLAKSAFKTVEWTDLMPADDLEALLNPPSYITDIEDGSFEDQISSQVQGALMAASDDRYQQALASHRVIPEMDGQPIRIPGFIVPIEFDDNHTITQFFLVPFFGACIHVPPPPPNQIIFVDYPEGLQLDALYEPFWISGIIDTTVIENEIASSAYSLKMQYFEVFEN